MESNEPITEIDARFSSPGATAMDWAEGRRRIEEAELFWLSTVRPDRRPHVTPLISVWLDGAAYICTGASERKAKNLAENPHCILTTGSNLLREGLDVVIEGEAERLDDEAALQRVADIYESKYGGEWHFDVRDGAFHGEAGNEAIVFEIRPAKVLGFGKGEYSQTSWRFG
jgi:nitroimidazol reductase NimA-like FMN-containing flavoprotein (pyridoxamine 5'-phosphate oxidase superfamily)